MNKAERIQKSEVARTKRHLKRKIAEKKLLSEYARLKKLRNKA